MILLDTHVWIWWVHNDSQLPTRLYQQLAQRMNEDFCVSAFSCWEVAKLVQLKRLKLPSPIDEWMREALDDSGINLFALTPEIAIEANNLLGTFHRDPADEIIVATARNYDCELATIDRKLIAYPHVKKLT